VAKILVADDNSNVQKTVALALGDLGVDIIAVNNGDAAIRKLVDVSPDLVLADIFMPVRNGYEVCEYVKKDSRHTHVPVVLLVGAFDPLDEREAQRVGADGILKKPFVPPDPLITMVKTLLDRSLSERLVAVSVSKPAAPVAEKAGGAAPTEAQSAHIEAPAELPQEFPPPVGRVSFGEGNHPIAFGQLLETPAQESSTGRTGTAEPVDDDQVLTSPRDAALGDPIFWQPEEPETDEENPEEGDAPSDAYGLAWEQGVDEAPVEPPASHQEPAHEPAHETAESFELVRDDQDEPGNQHPTIVEPSSLVQDPASQASLTVTAGKAEDLAANPIEWMATAPPLHAEEPPSNAHALDEFASEGTADVVEPVEVKSVAQSEPILPPSSVPLAPPFPAPPVAIPEPPGFAAMPEPKITNETPPPAKTPAPFDPFAQSTEDTARSIPQQQWSDLAASLQFKSSDSATEKTKPLAPAAMPSQVPVRPAENTQISAPNPAVSAPSTPPAPPDPALVEAVVQRVLDKMRPQVVDIITKEFLRPVVQALVHREIEKR
jgi:CheY-like chemotaxis protein